MRIKKEGDLYYRSDGYVGIYLPDHPDAKKNNGYVLLHRYVMEQHIGRRLEKGEVVHHIDHNKVNNSIKNLELISNSEHVRRHSLEHGSLYVQLKCPWCETIFEIPKRSSFLQKRNKYSCNCCSSSCRGKLCREVQLFGISEKRRQLMDENFIKEFRKFKNEESRSAEEETL